MTPCAVQRHRDSVILPSLAKHRLKGDVIADARAFNEAEQTRFRNLLNLAKESPYEGERVAALAAAERMAKSRGMTLEEAAGGGPAPKRPEARYPHFSRKQAKDAFGLAKAARMTDAWTEADKARRDTAMEEARQRGLDEEERRREAAAANRVVRRNNRKRDPQSHARVLLQETSLPLEEICMLTGLDIYQVVGMKLEMRRGDC